MPTPKSAVYRSPLALSNGGTVYAACVGPDEHLGMAALKHFAGLAPIGWKVVSVDSEDAGAPAVNAIDDHPATEWQTRPGADSGGSHQITVDMGSVCRIAGFAYLPRQDRMHNGMVDAYRFETSVDGQNWTTDIDAGHFGNIRNNPEPQEAPFAPVDARYFRFTALHSFSPNGVASAAEISVLPADSGK